MSNVEVLRDIILNAPLYTSKKITGKFPSDTLGRLKPINYNCEVCESVQTFKLTEINNGEPHEYQQAVSHSIAAGIRSVATTRYLTDTVHNLVFDCQMCSRYKVYFAIAFTYTPENEGVYAPAKGVTVIKKFGQLPPQELALDQDIEKQLTSKDKALYKKGLRAEAFGFGIGAHAYFRRIVENNIEAILDDIYSSTDDEELKKTIEEARLKTTATDRLELVKDHAPASYSHGDQNVFKTLYGSLSQGIHNKTDSQCLSIAADIRVCLDFLIKKIRRNKENETDLNRALGKISSK